MSIQDHIALLRNLVPDPATPPTYAEALAAVLDGYEAMQRELHTTTAALKWMAQRGAHVAWSNDCETCNVWLPAERDETPARPAEGYPQKSYYSWEEAIAAASSIPLAKLGEPK